MMGQHDRSETLFYYFRLEDQIPESQPLRFFWEPRTSAQRGLGRGDKELCRQHRTRPCKKRKEGAPSAEIVPTSNQGVGHPPLRCQLENRAVSCVTAAERSPVEIAS